MNKTTTFVYRYDGNAYINLTNRCPNDCVFCLRRSRDGVGGEVLWLTREPLAEEVVGQLNELITQQTDINAVVFCGFGEPTYKLCELIAVAEYAHSVGKYTRLNTNGLGSAIHGFDIVPKLIGVIDTVSISLNESSPERYAAVCRPEFGLDAYGYILDFAQKCVEAGIKTVLSVVDVIPPDEIEKCRQTAQQIGAEFRLRKAIE